ncbi:hypothetical protein FRC0049_02172 [Corynebacterium diphtheriae]|nr:hypothetical protein FRC0049_02172 [Corynebacterium diphtheriae]
MHPKTGRATKRGYFEGFFSELHTKSLPNRPFDWIWCEVPSFRGVSGGGVYGNATGGRRGATLGGLTNGLVITFLPAFLLGVLGNFGDADFGWFGMLVGGGARVGGRLGIVLVILVGLVGATEGRSGSSEPLNGGISKDFSQSFTPNRFQTGRLGRFGVKCRLFGGERGGSPTSAHQRPPTPANPSRAMVVENVLFRVVPRSNPRRTNQCTLKPEEPLAACEEVQHECDNACNNVQDGGPK